VVKKTLMPKGKEIPGVRTLKGKYAVVTGAGKGIGPLSPNASWKMRLQESLSWNTIVVSGGMI